MRIKNIIFDWSGTLVDDLPAVWRASNFVFRQARVPELTLDQFRQEFQLPFTKFYDRFTPHVPMERLEEWFHASFREVQDLVEALPHAREFLRFCRDRHVRTFLLSTVSEEHFAKQSAKTGFGPYIDTPYLGVWDKRKKIHEILRAHQLAPDETLFIGDMEHDIETAKHGGVHSCAVLTGYNKQHQLQAAEPDVLVEHLGELREMLAASGLRLEPALRVNGARGDHPLVTVGGAVFDEDGRILMVRTPKWAHKWGIPGGKVRRGETLDAALVRELREETGLEVEALKFVQLQDVIDPDEYFRPAHFVLLNYRCRAASQQTVKLNSEGEDWRWVTLAQALVLDLNQPSRRLLEALAADAPAAAVPA